MTQIAALAEFTTSLSGAALPAEVVDKVKLLVAHIFGSLIAGWDQTLGEVLTGYVMAQGGVEEATLIGAKKKYPVSNVVLANCAIANSLQLDDTHNESCTHMGSAIVPSVLAVAEKEGASGRDFITAIVAGAEITARVSLALNPENLYASGYHPSSRAVPFGVAGAAARLLHASPVQTATALNLAGVQSAGLMCGSGALSWYFQYGKAAQSGIYAAYLAMGGLTAPSDVFEGNRGLATVHGAGVDAGRLTAKLGEDFALNRLSFKMHSSLHFGQASIDALLKVLQDYGLDSAGITEIVLHLPTAAFRIIRDDPCPASALTAQVAPCYLMAIAAIDRKVTPEQYLPERLHDESVRDLARRVRVVPDRELDGLFPAHWPAKVEVTTREGQTYSCFVRNARGDAENPPTFEEIERHFLDLIGERVPEDISKAWLAKVKKLESLDDVRPLASILHLL